MKPETFDIIRQTVPVLEQHGELLADCFYKNMFHNNPEIKAFFNPAHQHSGAQQRALAATICAYARHIENFDQLQQLIGLITQKHVSFGIKPEHYPIVGNHFLLALREVMGESATEEVIEAWTEAYGVLAGIFIDKEDDLYHQQQDKYGWTGFKPFLLFRRYSESSDITSFYLRPTDNKPLQAYLPGQYITLKAQLTDGRQIMRNYSLSMSPRDDYFRISVKRHVGMLGQQAGVMSNLLHDRLHDGDLLLVSPPVGNFVLKRHDTANHPVLLIAGGVGITPLMAMLHSGLAQDSKRSFTLIQLARNDEVLPFYEELSGLAETYPNLHWHIRLSQPLTDDHNKQIHHSEGYIDHALFKQLSLDLQADYYLCGPPAMMQNTVRLLQEYGVNGSSIFIEYFGPYQQQPQARRFT